MGPKKLLGSKKLSGPKKFLGLKIILSPKKFLCSKSFWVKKFMGSKIIFPKKFLVPKKFLNPKNSVSQKFWVQKICVKKELALKILGPKNIWKNFGSEKNFGSKKIWFKKIIGWKKIRFRWVQKNLGPKNIWFKNILGPKKLGVQKDLNLINILSQKFLFPPLPYSIGLSKVGCIGRGGDGGSFLGFRVAYIPNLSHLQSLEPFEKWSSIWVLPTGG